MKKLPKVIYATWEEDADYPYLLAEQIIDGFAVRGEKRIIGVYELKEFQEIDLEVKSTVKTKKVK